MDLTKEIKTIEDYLKELTNLYFKAVESGEFSVAFDILVLIGREIVTQKNP